MLKKNFSYMICGKYKKEIPIGQVKFALHPLHLPIWTGVSTL
jgi:hypothetical protein